MKEKRRVLRTHVHHNLILPLKSVASLLMTWRENIDRWRRLPPERKLEIRQAAIPLDVAQSMAFEQEPVSEQQVRKMIARITPRAVPKRPLESSATPN